MHKTTKKIQTFCLAGLNYYINTFIIESALTFFILFAMLLDCNVQYLPHAIQYTQQRRTITVQCCFGNERLSLYFPESDKFVMVYYERNQSIVIHFYLFNIQLKSVKCLFGLTFVFMSRETLGVLPFALAPSFSVSLSHVNQFC